MKRYLVTGGAGFIGSSIVNKLSQKNRVRVFDNEFRGSKKQLEKNENLEYLKGDIRNFNQVLAASKNVDSIIHLAYINGTKYFYEKPDLVLEVGVAGILNIINAAKKSKVKELYLASSSEVYQTPSVIPTPETVSLNIPNPLNPRYSYGGGKIISELMTLHMASKFLNKVVIFRPHNVYGPKMGYEHVIPELILKILKLRKKSKNITLPVQGNGKSTRAFIYIDDFAEAIMILLNKGKNKEIYNVGTDEEVSINQLVKILSKLSSTNIKIRPTAQPNGSTQKRCPDITKIRKLGFRPRISLSEGLKKTYLWYNDELSKDEKS